MGKHRTRSYTCSRASTHINKPSRRLLSKKAEGPTTLYCSKIINEQTNKQTTDRPTKQASNTIIIIIIIVPEYPISIKLYIYIYIYILCTHTIFRGFGVLPLETQTGPKESSKSPRSGHARTQSFMAWGLGSRVDHFGPWVGWLFAVSFWHMYVHVYVYAYAYAYVYVYVLKKCFNIIIYIYYVLVWLSANHNYRWFYVQTYRRVGVFHSWFKPVCRLSFVLHHPLEYGQTVCLQTALRGFPRLQCVATSANDKRRQTRFSPH